MRLVERTLCDVEMEVGFEQDVFSVRQIREFLCTSRIVVYEAFHPSFVLDQPVYISLSRLAGHALHGGIYHNSPTPPVLGKDIPLPRTNASVYAHSSL